jgi:hypothetical protein
MRPQEGKRLLLAYLSSGTADKVFDRLFQDPGPAVLVVDDSLAWKMNSISYLANWDVVRAQMLEAVGRLSRSDFVARFGDSGVEPSTASRFYDEARALRPDERSSWVSQRAGFYEEPSLGQERDGEVSFSNGFIYRIKDKTLVSRTGRIPQSFFTVEEGQIVETPMREANINFSVFILKNADGYWCLRLDRSVARTLFVKLYFLEGTGLRHFSLVKKTRQEGRFVKVFAVDWAGR